MIRAAILRLGLAALASSAAAGVALAQQDVQITNEAIIQTCTEIHHSTNVQVDPPTIGGAQGITLNCRLIGSRRGHNCTSDAGRGVPAADRLDRMASRHGHAGVLPFKRR